MADNEYDDQSGGVDRQTENGTFAQKIPGLALDRIGPNTVAKRSFNKLTASAQNDQCYQRL